MHVETTTEWGKPLPAPDSIDAEFWAGLAIGELRYQRCPNCAHAQHYPRLICTRCGDDPVWELAEGRGVVHTFTVVRQFGMPPFRDELPYTVAMVELPEGIRLMGAITGIDPDEVRIGLEVEAWAVRVEDDLGVLHWRPVD